MPRKNPRFHFLGIPARSGELFVNFLELPLQHFRKHVRLSEWKIPLINPGDRNAVEDHVLVRATLRDFEEVADLPDDVHGQLVEDLVVAIWAWRAGVDAGKRGLSNEKEAQRVLFSNIKRALKRAGLSATRWRKTYDGDGGPDTDAPESFYFRLIRALGAVFDIPIPKDLMVATERASEIQYVMSSAMKAWQDAELAAQARQRLDQLAVRLSTTQGTATTLAVPEAVYEGLPLELRLLALGLSSAKTLAGSSFA
jgi:hypothetical protein